MRGFLGESALSTLKVESAESRNFSEFAFLTSCENVLFGSLCNILTKKVENRLENAQKLINLFIYLIAKVYTHEFFSAKRPRKLIPAEVFEATRRPRNFVPGALSTVRNMCVPWGFYPLGLLSAGAFVRRGFYPLGLLSVGLFSAGLLSVGLLSAALFSAPPEICPLINFPPRNLPQENYP